MKLKAFVLTIVFIMSVCHLSNTFSDDKTMNVMGTKKSIIIRKPLLTALLHSNLVEKIEIKEINLVPGQATGLHIHPVPVVGYIAQGSILFQIEGIPSKILFKGDAFYEPANSKIIHFDNISKHRNTKFIAFYLLTKEDHTLIQMIKN